MSFVFAPNLGILKQTTEKGQLLSVSDTTAQHTVGAAHYDNKNDKAYVYAYNAVGGALSDNDPYLLIPQNSNGTGGNWKVVAIADDTLDKHKYVCVPAALTPIAYYGWMQVQGDVSVNSSDVGVFGDEAWAVNDELYITAAIAATVADTALGVPDLAFAFVNDSRASTAVTENSIYLIGREVVTTSA
jgi:hypothetical protein